MRVKRLGGTVKKGPPRFPQGFLSEEIPPTGIEVAWVKEAIVGSFSA